MTNLQKISILCTAVLTMGLTACGETNVSEEKSIDFWDPYKDNRYSQSDNSEQNSQSSTDSFADSYIENETDYYEYEPVDVKLNENLAIACYEDEITYAIIRSDGTVKTMGSNEYGQLGCSSTDTIPGWNTISDLENVKQIIGMNIIFIALTEEGNLYYWGGLTTKPTKIETDINIQEFKKTYDNRIYAEDDKRNIISIDVETDGSDFRCKPPIFKTLDYPSGAIPAYDGYILNGHYYTEVYKDGNYEQISSKCNNIKSSPSSHLYITDIGSITSISTRDDELYEEDLGGSGIIDHRQIYVSHEESTTYELFSNGTLKARGDNQYGQLGDGTTYSSDSYLEIISNISELYLSDGRYNNTGTVFALSNDGNLYSWGRHFSSTPTIVVYNQDFCY